MAQAHTQAEPDAPAAACQARRAGARDTEESRLIAMPTQMRSLGDRLGGARVSEADFQAAVMEYAQLRGWLVFHDHDSRKNLPGLPDLILTRPGRLIFAELKVARRRLRPEQQAWLETLSTVPGVETFLWRWPKSWELIEATLR